MTRTKQKQTHRHREQNWFPLGKWEVERGNRGLVATNYYV